MREDTIQESGGLRLANTRLESMHLSVPGGSCPRLFRNHGGRRVGVHVGMILKVLANAWELQHLRDTVPSNPGVRRKARALLQRWPSFCITSYSPRLPGSYR